jgi:hypothetical protein
MLWLATGATACSNGGPVDGGVDAQDVTASDAADALDAADVGPLEDVADAGDAADVPASDVADVADARVVSFVVSVRVEQLAQSCMPGAPTDAVSFHGAVVVMNNGSVPVGPVTVGEGAIVNIAGMELARFAVDPAMVATVAPGTTGEAAVTKTAGSLVPARCRAELCGQLVRVRLAISGSGIPAGAAANSPLQYADCTR